MAVRLDEFGREVPDPRPLQIPAGFKRPETLAETVQRLVRGQLSRQAQEQGFETFEESEDFDIGDEIDMSTPYETFFDPVLGKEITPADFERFREHYRSEYLKRQAEQDAAVDRSAAIQEAIQRGRKGGGSKRTPPSSGEDPPPTGDSP